MPDVDQTQRREMRVPRSKQPVEFSLRTVQKACDFADLADGLSLMFRRRANVTNRGRRLRAVHGTSDNLDVTERSINPRKVMFLVVSASISETDQYSRTDYTGCFGPEDTPWQRNQRLARPLGFAPTTLGPDHQGSDVGGGPLPCRVCGVGRWMISNKLGERLKSGKGRQPDAAALHPSLANDSMPTLVLFRGSIGVPTHDRPVGDQRNDVVDP